MLSIEARIMEARMQQGASVGDDVRDSQRQHWDTVSDGWAEWFDWTERNFSPVTDWFHEAGVWRPGTRVLDVACGAGYPALAAAAAVGPDGQVLATDITPGMVAATARNATARGLDNIQVREMDAEHLTFDDGEFDAVTSAYGLMFCPGVAKAFAEAYRVLKPGARLGLVTWDAPEKSPFFLTMRPVGAKFLSLQAPRPDGPGPFRLSDPAALESLLRATGFKDIRVDSRSMVIDCASPAEYFQVFCDIAWKAKIAALPEADVVRFKQAVVEATRPFIEGGRVRLVASSLCTSASK
jgi:ubiquinone/menaquinone biosynthesis C-methylase UbiE